MGHHITHSPTYCKDVMERMDYIVKTHSTKYTSPTGKTQNRHWITKTPHTSQHSYSTVKRNELTCLLCFLSPTSQGIVDWMHYLGVSYGMLAAEYWANTPFWNEQELTEVPFHSARECYKEMAFTSNYRISVSEISNVPFHINRTFLNAMQVNICIIRYNMMIFRN